MTAAQKLSVHDAFLAVPDTQVAQIVDGELYVQPRPRVAHARVTSRVGAELGPPFDRGRGGGPGGWILLDEPELQLGGDILVPDLAGWRRERMPEVPDAAYTTLPPDWVCEVLSPSTVKLDRGKKLSAYAREGVPFVWLIDPDAQTLEVLVLQAFEGTQRYVVESVHAEQAIVHARPFAVFALELGVLWER